MRIIPKLTALAVLLAAAGGASAQVVTLNAPTFSVTFNPNDGINLGPFYPPGLTLVGDSLHWLGVGWSAWVLPGQSIDAFNYAPLFDFEPASGYRIVGYDFFYQASYQGPMLVVQPGDLVEDLGPVGTVYTGSGRLQTSIGPVITFSGTPQNETKTATNHLDGASFPANFIVQATATGIGELCWRATPDGAFCANWVLAPASTRLDFVDITPLVVAIPEPETYALMLAGLGVLGFGARRRRLLTTACPDANVVLHT